MVVEFKSFRPQSLNTMKANTYTGSVNDRRRRNI